MMDQGEVYFLKLNSGEDLLCQLVGDEEEYLFITQPYRVDLMQSAATMTVTTTIMRWIPFESLMEETICLDKKNVLTYMEVDDIVAMKYRNTISDQSKKEREETMDRLLRMSKLLQEPSSNTFGTLH
jgi:hypothetical protein